jgi:hypothetical protein
MTRGSRIAISVPFTAKGVIADNVLIGFCDIGIEINGDQDEVTIVGNVLDPDGTACVSGIQSNGLPIKNIRISGNTIKNFTAASGTAVRFNTGTTADGVAVTGNSLISACSGFTALQSSGPVKNLTFSGNLIDGGSATGARGFEFNNAVTGVTITGNQFSNLPLSVVRLASDTAVTQENIEITGNAYVNCGPVLDNANYGAGSGSTVQNISADLSTSDQTPP